MELGIINPSRESSRVASRGQTIPEGTTPDCLESLSWTSSGVSGCWNLGSDQQARAGGDNVKFSTSTTSGNSARRTIRRIWNRKPKRRPTYGLRRRKRPGQTKPLHPLHHHLHLEPRLLPQPRSRTDAPQRRVVVVWTRLRRSGTQTTTGVVFGAMRRRCASTSKEEGIKHRLEWALDSGPWRTLQRGEVGIRILLWVRLSWISSSPGSSTRGRASSGDS